MRLARLVRAPLAAASLVLMGLVVAACGQQGQTADAIKAGVDPYVGDVVMGDANAKVEIVEYASLTCPHCRDFWKQVFPRVKTAYIDTNKVRYILKDFPTQPAEVAIGGVAVARCAGKDRYYEVIDRMFSNWGELMDASRKGEAGLMLSRIGGDYGLTPAQVGACINHPGVREMINRNIEEGSQRQKDAGSNQVVTPAVFINGKYIPDHSYDSLSAAIESALNPSATPAVAPAAPAAPAATTAPAPQ
jgi:protein-disulfide isomerase